MEVIASTGNKDRNVHVVTWCVLRLAEELSAVVYLVVLVSLYCG